MTMEQVFRDVVQCLSDASDNLLIMSYIPLMVTNFLVAITYGLWAYGLFRGTTPVLRHLVLGIAVQFFFGSFEQACIAYYRFTGNYAAWGQNYPLLLTIKLGYMAAGCLHLYGYLKVTGRRKWFWRLMYVLPLIVALQAVLGVGLYGDLVPANQR